MRTASYLRRKGSRFHFRRRVPYDLREKVGREEIRFSLGTSERRVASDRAKKVWVAVQEVFEQVGCDVTVTPEEIAGLLSSAIRDFEWADEIRLARDGSLFDHDGDAPVDADAIVLGVQAADYRDALQRNDVSGVRPLITRYAARLGRPLPIHGLDERLIGRAILRLLIDNCDDTAARIAAQLRRAAPTVEETLFPNPIETSEIDPVGIAEPTLVDVIDTPTMETPRANPDAVIDATTSSSVITISQAWADAKVDLIRRKVWRAGDAAHADSSRKLLIGVIGDKPLEEVGKQDAVAFRRTIAGLPALYHRSKEWRDLSLAEIVARADEIDKEAVKNGSAERVDRMATKTVNRHISQLKVVWGTFCEIQHVTASAANPFDKLHTKVRKSRQEVKEERDQFSEPELRALFGCPVWAGCKNSARRKEPGAQIIRDWKFWIPLIALYSGMRREEICALTVGDFELVDGIWIINLRKAKQRLKTAGSERYVPVHNELLRIGIVSDLVAGRPHDDWLFPDLTPSAVGDRRGEPFGKWFSQLRKDLNIYRAKVVFHSLRHNFSTALTNAEAHEPFVVEMTGHDDDRRTGVIDRYKKPLLIRKLKETIDLLNYDIDFTHLYAAPSIGVKS